MKLIAENPILYQNKQYRKGDVLPADTDMQEVWIACGSAAFKEENETKKIPVKGRRVTAQSGLAGTAVNSESEINLVGRVPDTERRRRK
nr:MAG TPA: hypothetical protein [Caudoviricetes sp.]